MNPPPGPTATPKHLHCLIKKTSDKENHPAHKLLNNLNNNKDNKRFLVIASPKGLR